MTALCWNPQYLDLFAVGYGSYEFLKQASGLVHIFSLKNPSHPEFTLATEAGVMSLHFHPGACGALGWLRSRCLGFLDALQHHHPLHIRAPHTRLHLQTTEYSNLLAVGCYDGTVAVYDVHLKNGQPIYKASVRTGKHNDPVWSIFWQVCGFGGLSRAGCGCVGSSCGRFVPR